MKSTQSPTHRHRLVDNAPFRIVAIVVVVVAVAVAVVVAAAAVVVVVVVVVLRFSKTYNVHYSHLYIFQSCVNERMIH